MQELAKDQQILDLIIELNTREQLFNQGVNSDGTPLTLIGGRYSESTIEGVPGKFAGKRELGLPTDHVTLFQTGDFYASWRVFLDSNNDFEITNNPIKDGVNILDRWGVRVLGLTGESQAKFNDMVREKVPEIVLNLIDKALAA